MPEAIGSTASYETVGRLGGEPTLLLDQWGALLQAICICETHEQRESAKR